MIDKLVKSLQDRHSLESGSSELVDLTGFPLSRNDDNGAFQLFTRPS